MYDSDIVVYISPFLAYFNWLFTGSEFILLGVAPTLEGCKY